MKLASPLASTLVRATLLALAALASLASAEPRNPPPAYPYGGAGPDPYGQPYPPAPGESTAPGAGTGSAPPQVGGAPGQDYCFTLSTPQTTTSMCSVGFGACERQRNAAKADGQQASECVPWSPVACFQLGADPSPASRFCAANLEDCELWRHLDEQKNGKTGDACAWKQ